MTEQECLNKMVAPGTRRPGKYREGVIQIHVTRACDKACFNCTQGSQLGGKTEFMLPEHFKQAVDSLKGYFGVVGVFGGNPAMSHYFVTYCEILRNSWVPFNQRGLWCNNPISVDKACAARLTFDPSVSNLNVHLDQRAYDMFKLYWPECQPCGLTTDSRHSPPYVAMKDVVTKEVGAMTEDEFGCLATTTITVPDESRIWELISDCDINQHWSAMIGVFRGELRAWFCEIAGAQAMLHQDELDYPDTGLEIFRDGSWLRNVWIDGVRTKTGCADPRDSWWKMPMSVFEDQVRKHCFDCGVPMRGYGELAQASDGTEQVSDTHAAVYKMKRKDRIIQLLRGSAGLEQLGIGKLQTMTHYLQNSKR